jgi:hypothetical protein
VFHDIVYNTPARHAGANEEDSAVAFQQFCDDAVPALDSIRDKVSMVVVLCVCVCVCVLSHWAHAAIVEVPDLPSLKCSSHWFCPHSNVHPIGQSLPRILSSAVAIVVIMVMIIVADIVGAVPVAVAVLLLLLVVLAAKAVSVNAVVAVVLSRDRGNGSGCGLMHVVTCAPCLR